MEELREKIKRVTKKMQEEIEIFLSQFNSVFGERKKKINFELVKEFNIKRRAI